MGRIAIFTAYLAMASLGFPSTSHAYLDPGTGSIVLQAVVGSIAAAGAAFGLYWQRLKSYFSKHKASAEAGENGEKGAD